MHKGASASDLDNEGRDILDELHLRNMAFEHALDQAASEVSSFICRKWPLNSRKVSIAATPARLLPSWKPWLRAIAMPRRAASVSRSCSPS